MSKFIQGLAHNQSTSLPKYLDDLVVEKGALRLIDIFIDELNIADLGFKSAANNTG